MMSLQATVTRANASFNDDYLMTEIQEDVMLKLSNVYQLPQKLVDSQDEKPIKCVSVFILSRENLFSVKVYAGVQITT